MRFECLETWRVKMKTTLAVFLRLEVTERNHKNIHFPIGQSALIYSLGFIFVVMESQYSMLLGWMILSMLLGWMMLSSILTTKCYYHDRGKSNEQTLHEETTYSCWHAGTNNEQTSLRTTAPIFQSRKLWWYDIMWHPEKSCWSSGLVSENPWWSPLEFVAGIVIIFCWNLD